ncbi:MAG: hypothetical protein J6P16_01755 [Eubacterium sp.]|nr:hypothetical protein [Eubacterium sp.]
MTEENKVTNKQNTPKRPASQRVFAWIIIILLVGMYTATLIFAISGNGSASSLFMMSLGATVVLPGLLWLHIRFWQFSMGRDRKTFGVDADATENGALENHGSDGEVSGSNASEANGKSADSNG